MITMPWWSLILVVAGALCAGVLCAMACSAFGFRMGRQSIDKPLAPIAKRKTERLIEEDPFHKPMTGEDQASYPTVGR